MDATVQKTLDQLQVTAFIRAQEQEALLRELRFPDDGFTVQTPTEQLIRYGLIIESELIDSWREGRRDEIDRSAELAYSCWRSLLDIASPAQAAFNAFGPCPLPPEFRALECADDWITVGLSVPFRIAVLSVLTHRLAESRLLLLRFNLIESPTRLPWRVQVAAEVFRAFILLSRKGNGWNDVNAAIRSIDRLRALQEDFESAYLSDVPSHEQRATALELVGLYHLAQLITLTARYLISGRQGAARVRTQLERHIDRALQAFDAAHCSSLSNLAILLLLGCQCHIDNSVWTHVAAIAPLREFVSKVAVENVTSPLIELWPAQQDALKSSFLDPYKTAISVQMPTSAGKTLLAKFAIVQTRALTANATIAYIVPTRALVNQVTRELRRDFRPLGLRVEQAVPAMEMDPTESLLLATAPDVLVTTPEKLDLLVRDNHPATQALGLVIADEAHNLQDGKRGDRLELLLGVIKRDKPDVRFLLLSPFIPNADELVEWLGDGRALTPIQVEWRPSRRIVGMLSNSGSKHAKRLVLETVEAAQSVDVAAGRIVSLGAPSQKQTIESISLAAVEQLCRRGTVLVLCRGKGTANLRSVQIANGRSAKAGGDLLNAVCAYIETEVGASSDLAFCLRRGVAYHHAGLSQESRWLVERLICEESVDVVCGTTTLAQGVNFPISSVVVETLQKGRAGKMSHSDFWNIAGRAGRAMVDTLGLIAFPAPSKDQRKALTDFLKKDAEAIVSQLMDMLLSIDLLSNKLGLKAVRENEHLSTFLRYLSHAVRVAGNTPAADDIEDILRGSLLYHQARKQSAELSRKLVGFCRSYMAQIAGSSLGVLTLADRTGFATPSVQYLLQVIRNEHADFRKAETWDPRRLFGENTDLLAERIKVIADVPEITLGQSDEVAPFSPDLVAKIIRDWVNGTPLQQMADAHWKDPKADAPGRLTAFSDYLFGRVIPQASWGLGALQGCSLGDESMSAESAIPFVPSMAFFGVRQREAVWLRMVGAPRIVAEPLAEIWKRESRPEPTSHQELRDWITDRSDAQWREVTPKNSALTFADLKRLWLEFA